LTEDKLEEETYSLIFTSLKHPIRRRILRMLADKPLTFSEIQESITIDSGHLSYHLESLGDLIVHNQNGKYQLSSIGVAAVRLMSGVEEQTPAAFHSKLKLSDVVSKIFSIILVAILIVVSVHFVTYATPVSTVGLSQDHIHPTPLLIGAGETIEFNLTLTERELWLLGTPPLITTGGINLSEVNGSYAYTFGIPWMTRNITTWDRCSIWLDLKLEMSSVPVEPSSIPHITLQMPPFSNLSVTVHKPDGTMETSGFDWISLVWGINHIRLPAVEITQLGTYRFKITNNNSYDWNGELTPDVEWQRITKPYFYYGIMGLVIATGYIALISYKLLSKSHKTSNK
jgi:DNA-binding transcriptional ArsR family regulator